MFLTNLLGYFRWSNPSPIEILPTEMLTNILVSEVPYWEHSTCTKVCRKWKEILDNAQLSEVYKNCIYKCIDQTAIIIEGLTGIENLLANRKQTRWEGFLGDVIESVNSIIFEGSKTCTTKYHHIHILNGSYNYKWICEKFKSIQNYIIQSQKNIEKAIKIYDDKASYDTQENNPLINRISRNVLENIASPIISFNKQHSILSLQELTSHIESFIKRNLFTANKQFVCLFTDPSFFLRLVTDNIFEDPKHSQDDSEVKVCPNLFSDTEETLEIKMYDHEATGKWYGFLHGCIPNSWSNDILECFNNVLSRIYREDQKSKKRALEIKHEIDSEPLLKKARKVFSFYFK